MTLRGRQICSLGSSYVLFINLLKRHLTLLHQSCRASATVRWSCLPSIDWLRCFSTTPWPISVAGGPEHVWSQPTGGQLSSSSCVSAASLWKTAQEEALTYSSSELDRVFPQHAMQTKFKFMLELHSANCSLIKDIPLFGMCHPSLSVTAHSSVVAHDSFSMSIHKLIDISIGIPTQG